MNNAFLNKLISTDAGWGALALRIPVGIIFAAHGAQKLFGWFGGYGLEGTGRGTCICHAGRHFQRSYRQRPVHE